MKVREIVEQVKTERLNKERFDAKKLLDESKEILRKETEQWISNFERRYFSTASDNETVASIILRNRYIELRCPPSWISVGMYGSEHTNFPKILKDFIKSLEDKFEIGIDLKDVSHTKFEGSIPIHKILEVRMIFKVD